MAICAAMFTKAQDVPQFGIKGGLNVATLNVTGSSGSISSKVSGHGGLVAHIHVAPQFAIQPEVLYSGQGMKQVLGNKTYDWNLGYINIPIMLQYMVSNGFRIEAGPQFGILASAKIKDDVGTTDIKNDLKGSDVGLGFGLSYVGPGGLGVGGRYNLGLSNINKTGSNEIKNSVGQFSVFYMFSHSGRMVRR